MAPGALWARVRRLAHPLTAMTSATSSRHDAAAPEGSHALAVDARVPDSVTVLSGRWLAKLSLLLLLMGACC